MASLYGRPAKSAVVVRHGLIAGVGLAGLVLAFAGTDDMVALPMYFTEQSTMAVVAYFGHRAWRRRSAGTSPAVCGAVTVYITLTGLVFHFVLIDGLNPFALLFDGVGRVPEEAGNFLLHYVLPPAVMANWLAFEPKGGLRYRHAAIWLIGPMTYLTMVLVRGAFFAAGQYPYPFLDAARLGYALVARNSAWLGVCFYAIGLLYVSLDRLAGWRRRSAAHLVRRE